MLAPPLDEDVLQQLRAVTDRAFAHARTAGDIALMEECIRLIILIDRKLEDLLFKAARS